MRGTLLCLQTEPREEESPVFPSIGLYSQLLFAFYGELAALLSHWVDAFCGLHMLILIQQYHMGFFKTSYGYLLALMRFDKYIKVFIKSK